MDRRLLDLLACPACKGSLQPCAEQRALCCQHCKLRFPVRDGIPVLLLEDAEPLDGESQ
nr:Trm112 family protein [Acidithiobacillus sp. AMEEHan]